MDQADSVLSTPPLNTSSCQPAKPQDALYPPTDATPEQIFQAIGRLRKEARDAIDELIRLLDKTDDYVSRELEDDGDQADASYPESGVRMCNPMEDDEEDDPAEQDDHGEDNGDREEETDTGIGDEDGLMEQVPQMFAHCDVRVEQ